MSAAERSGARDVKRAGRSKKMSEQSEQTRDRTSDWISGYLDIWLLWTTVPNLTSWSLMATSDMDLPKRVAFPLFLDSFTFLYRKVCPSVH